MAKGLIPYGEDLADAEDKAAKYHEQRKQIQKKRIIRPSKKRAKLAKIDAKLERQGVKIMAIEEVVKANPVSRESYKKIRAERDKKRAQEEREL